MLQLERAVVDRLGGLDALAAAVAEHLAALDAHRLTVGVAAPVPPPIVADIIAAGGMEAVELVDTPAAPAPARGILSLDFRRRFTPAERAAITLAASRAMDEGDATLQVWLDDCNAAGTIDLDAPEVSGALDLLVAAGLLSEERKEAVLA